MADLDPEIVAHYEVYDEADRLIRDNRLEFLRTAEIINRSAQPPPAVVVDVGGGPGVYATWLANQGYRVHLFDVVPRHVEAVLRASDTERLTAEIADARQIPMDDETCDRLLGVLRRLESEPALLGASPHLLAVAARPIGHPVRPGA
ncbi:MAG: methyltransferase domain-containing protein [Acidimicrobiia bacterium]|nr:methyltransferase domain-containing protein [Acidimicrobiia bacterium]